jgi:hypothetical protein
MRDALIILASAAGLGAIALTAWLIAWYLRAGPEHSR